MRRTIRRVFVIAALTAGFLAGLALFGWSALLQERKQADHDLELGFGISSSDIYNDEKIISCDLVWAGLEALKKDAENRQAEHDSASLAASNKSIKPSASFDQRLNASNRRLSAANKLALKYNCGPN